MFGDVSSGQWYTKAVAWAAENGIVNGYSNGNFGPNDPITREQLATILYRYTKFKSGSVEASRNYLNSFSDAGQVSAYAVEAMNWAVAGGLINGSGDKLMPTARASRAQVAAIIHRYLEG
ncbi:MAG: S-layer homology domain-containing protein, partial [Clostridiales bacterium]|nr:S-layer homology domain-containing protein [Clostridiales bacterium]